VIAPGRPRTFHGLLGAACAAWTTACALPAPLREAATPPASAAPVEAAQAQAPASVTVAVYGGLARGGAPAPVAAARVEVVVDLTRSMLAPAPNGRSRADLARSSAAQLLSSLRDGTEIALRSMGDAASAQCTGSERLGDPALPARREPLVRRLRELTPRSEASLPATLDQVRLDLEREGAARRSRVVVFSDLESSCGGELCSAAERLVASGAWLEVVPLGSAAPPACLAEIRPAPSQPEPELAGAAAARPAFRVEQAGGEVGTAPLLATGEAGGPPVSVPAGLVKLVVQLDPPEEIGPFRLAPGEAAQVSVLESRGAGRPTRIWRVERGGEAVGRAFPPPDELPPRK
jgi:hypothetical protein